MLSPSTVGSSDCMSHCMHLTYSNSQWTTPLFGVSPSHSTPGCIGNHLTIHFWVLGYQYSTPNTSDTIVAIRSPDGVRTFNLAIAKPATCHYAKGNLPSEQRLYLRLAHDTLQKHCVLEEKVSILVKNIADLKKLTCTKHRWGRRRVIPSLLYIISLARYGFKW